MNGLDHRMVIDYLELYEEGSVSLINGVWPVFSFEQFFTVSAPSRCKNKIPQLNPYLFF